NRWPIDVTEPVVFVRIHRHRFSVCTNNRVRFHGVSSIIPTCNQHSVPECTHEERACLAVREIASRRSARSIRHNTPRGELAAVMAMFGWCVDQGWLAANPFADVTPQGRKAVRKNHLRIEEARAVDRA